jgi:hypothetical protein
LIPLPVVMQNVFPHHDWLIKIIHISTLSAILGTIHAVIWSCSHFLISVVKKLKGPIAKKALSSGFLNARTSVILVGLPVFISFLTFKNIDLFFDLAAIFIVFAYVTAMIPLLKIKEEWKNKQNIKTLIGIATASFMIIVAVSDIIKIFS